MRYLFLEISDGLRTAIAHFATPTCRGKIITLELIVALGRSICDICSMCMSNRCCGYIPIRQLNYFIHSINRIIHA